MYDVDRFYRLNILLKVSKLKHNNIEEDGNLKKLKTLIRQELIVLNSVTV